MQIQKWRHRMLLFFWQQKRRLILLFAAVVALLFSAFIGLPQWPPEFWYTAIGGVLVSIVIVMLTD